MLFSTRSFAIFFLVIATAVSALPALPVDSDLRREASNNRDWRRRKDLASGPNSDWKREASNRDWRRKELASGSNSDWNHEAFNKDWRREELASGPNSDWKREASNTGSEERRARIRSKLELEAARE
ncbi:hypothetical protein D9615_005114 [Tricholomella constricta]|uniref:Uncharacterized protein n=1 Tax=Tricholomella constricta TaxID=117010 RepID=A0A8H5H684_9AGAR|nr:hypothetical protein D9615_005114 [Tricholomella constricta]